MKKQGDQIIFSPSDLVTYFDSPFATWMNRWKLESPETCPDRDPEDPLLRHLAETGLQHESQFLQTLHEDASKVIIEIPDKELSDDERFNMTLDAMETGADVIFQACLMKDNLRGYADFLVKVPGQSRFGEYLYEPWDTKLSKSVKPYFLIQLGCYADLLAGVQGARPEGMAVVLGDQTIERFHVSNFIDFYYAKRNELLDQQAEFDLSNMPDPFAFSSHGDWTEFVENLRVERDHLSLVAHITRRQIAKLESAGIKTLAELATTQKSSIPNLNPVIFDKLKKQAAMQLRSRETGETCFEVIMDAADEGQGLALLPPHNDSDLFWDLEGYPLAEGGLEYLWGCAYFDEQQKLAFWERWAHDHDAEKKAFIDFISFAYKRWLDNPGMCIYHYGHYELSVCQRLMGRYGVCENEVDQLLRYGVFVDLYKVVRHGILLGEPKYSIKNVEHLYRGKRDTEVASGGDSVAVYAKWSDLPDGTTWQTSKTLRQIRDYNIDDCNSTQELVAWLREQQTLHGIKYVKADEESIAVPHEETEEDRIESGLYAIAEDSAESESHRSIANQLAGLVKFHARANKPMWWRYFERLGKNLDELYEDPDCIAGCVRTDREPFYFKDNDRNLCFEFTYDTRQEFRNRRFTQAQLVVEEQIRAEVCGIETNEGTLLLKSAKELPDYFDLIAYEYVRASPLEASIRRICEGFLEKRTLPKPLREFFLRLPPDVDRDELIEIDKLDGIEKLNQIVSTVTTLNNSYISIQGPPGTGKTYTAKHIMLELLRQGKSIGITSNSHKAINHLMLQLAALLEAKGETYQLIKIEREADPQFINTRIEQVENNGAISKCCAPGAVVGATAWGFCREDAHVDFLFIDEAGQVSLANFVAMSAQAQNIVCLGDQMQLPQPVEGTHPGDSGLSILDYTLKDCPTIPRDMGIFLNRTYRMHEDVNAFVSEGIYESRLENDPACNNQAILFESSQTRLLRQQSGIQYCPVEHVGNKQASAEEVAVVQDLVSELLSSQWRDKNNVERALTLEDILIVAPFNYQVNELRKSLGDDARVGTVDKFQGQEAPVVIVSMAASCATDSARGADFLLNKNRINVAISRAQALAVVVASTTLLDGAPGKIEDIETYNLFYKLLNKSH